MWSSVLDALFTGLAVFLALELHYKVKQVREVSGGKVTFEGMTKPMADLISDQKTEFLPPMDDEEYEKHMFEQSGRGELVRTVLSRLPWISKVKNSQSSDS